MNIHEAGPSKPKRAKIQVKNPKILTGEELEALANDFSSEDEFDGDDSDSWCGQNYAESSDDSAVMERGITPISKSGNNFTRSKSGSKRIISSQAMNLTYASVSGLTAHTKSAPQNFPRRHLLDVSLSHFPPKIKTSACMTVSDSIDYQLEAELYFGEYIESLIQQEHVKLHFNHQKKLILHQIIIHDEDLNKIQVLRDLIDYKISELRTTLDIVDVLSHLQKCLDDLINMYSFYGISNEISLLKYVLQNECSNIECKKMKPIITQDQFDKLLQQIYTCQISVEQKLIKVGIKYEHTHGLITKINNLRLLRMCLENQYRITSKTLKRNVSNFLAIASDVFAKGEYL